MYTQEIIMLTPVSTTTATTTKTTASVTTTSAATTTSKLTPFGGYKNEMFNTKKLSQSTAAVAKKASVKPKSFQKLSSVWLWSLLIITTLRVTYSQGKCCLLQYFFIFIFIFLFWFLCFQTF